MRCTVWIVFNTLNNSWNSIFVAFEINYTVALFMTTTLMADSNTTGVVTTTIFSLFLYQRCIRCTFVQIWSTDLHHKSATC